MATDKNKEPNQNDKQPKQSTYQKLKQKWMAGNVLSKLAIFFSMVAVVLSCVSAFSNEFDINNHSFPLGVLSLLVTILIGWNIYQVIDLKSYKKKYEELNQKLENETNYLHNKSDYHYGLSMCYNSMCLAGSITDSSIKEIKIQMYLQAAQGLKILSNLGEFEHCKSVVGVLIETENCPNVIKLSNDEREQIYKQLIEVNHLDKIDGLFDLIGRIKPKDSDNK